MSTQASLQQFVHDLEKGRYSAAVKGAMFTTLTVALVLIYLFIHFAGLSSITAMDQAQIARNLAEGRGFTTDFIRPMAMWQLRQADKVDSVIDGEKMPDFFQAPLGPLVNALPLLSAKGSWKIQPTDLVYGPDRLLAGVAMCFFLLSVAVWYFVASHLFDRQLASLAAVLILVTDLFWRFSLSGLPQMLMLFLFSLAMLMTVLAQHFAQEEKLLPQFIFLAVAGLLMGLLTLTHALAAWIFIGWIIWVAIFFKSRAISVLIPLVCFFVVIAPWLIRNYQVCGNPFGLSIYAARFNEPLEEILLRSTEPDFSKAVTMKSKLRAGVISQMSNLLSFLGLNFVAGFFFVSLMHPFRNLQTASLRWGVLLMWVLAVIGMAIFGVEGAVSVNQLHILFLPLFVFYGLALLMVLWNRLQVMEDFLRKAFIVLIVFVTSIPLLLTVFGGPQQRIQWPPYVPPIIGVLGDWFQKDEIICSDMPWAVAWYAQRKSLLLPMTVRSFIQIHDFKELKLSMPALYLTPVTGNRKLFADIYKGPYKEWVPIIIRPPQTRGFPLTTFTPLPIEGECIIFADRDRWNEARQ